MLATGQGESIANGRIALQELTRVITKFTPDSVGVHLEVVQLLRI